MRSLIFAALLLAAPLCAQGVNLAAPDRPADEVKLDASRKPLEMMAFSKVKPGDTVLDVIAGDGYYSRLYAQAVGPKGAVVALLPPGYFDEATFEPGWKALIAAHPNVRFVKAQLADAELPKGVDLTVFHLVYHDLYWESAKYKFPRMDPAAFLTKLYAATDKGGRVLVIDHVAPAGSDVRAFVEKTHRIDPAVIKADFAKAGFVLDGESDLLRTPGDDLNLLVFNPAVRGKTDRVVYRFVKK
ncbi:class I SAM-dependent methyltransferase [Sandaracinobacteroides saxicola]|uniref:Class I SAM-dependent methyltransferase n=1 Tax=Sandaracinobacteroides saxicola TaxID=2759707 RepID=A0A7G5ILC4_9SPHN|nr:class I SAM-dependent methyltransferase [Sandaracinobacteroides saxicola]QMW24166.1 class I SAM-dependent methyltransferase [Sandaracinobacteroides saxicola]